MPCSRSTLDLADERAERMIKAVKQEAMGVLKK